MKNMLDFNSLDSKLAAIDKKMAVLNNEKIKHFIDALDLSPGDIPEGYLQWETILVVSPDRHVAQQIKKYKFSIDRLAFATNVYAQKIHLFDFDEWQRQTRFKSQAQLREFLKSNFGGEAKKS